MRLKTLELQGYKSFAAKTAFQFDEGITAIVGPNGSGKSNISDAMRWALGEQSFSALRGKKTEDMIFSGSDGRARLGMAQVSLTLDNSDSSLPVEFSEVTIVRRAFRDGQNEYLLNGSRVRLRDINELLAVSGLSRRTYTVIGQGLVDAALSLRAEERRDLFEEAAGIMLHRSKRAEALQKLDGTQANVLRLHDIVSEIEPRLRYLQRQAERAAQHEAILSQLKGLLNMWYGYRWATGQKRLHETRLAAEKSQHSLDQHSGQVERIARQIGELRSRQAQLRKEVGQWHRESSHLHYQAEAFQRELAVGEERARLLHAQREELVSEVELLQAARQAAEEQVAAAQASVAEIEQELEDARSRVEELRARLDAHQAERHALRDLQLKAEQEARQLADRMATGRARLVQGNERGAHLDAEVQESRQAIEQQRQKQESLRQRLAAKDEQLQQVMAELGGLEAGRAESLAAVQKLDEQAAALEESIALCRRRLEGLHARQDLLSRMQRDLAGFYEGVRTVLQAARGGETLRGVIGTVVHLLQVPVELENAFDAALAGHLQDVVVETWADAEAAIAYLKATHGGRATFLPLDTLRPPGRISPPQTDGVLGVAADLAGYEARLAPVAALLLGRTLVVEDLAAARRALSAMHGGFQIVTRAGELVRSGGSVSGGSVSRDKAGGGFLAREREWRELPVAIAEQEARLEAFEAQLDENRYVQAEHQSALEELARRQAGLETGRAGAQREREVVEREIERAEEAIQWQTGRLDRLEAERAELERGEERLQAEIIELQTTQLQAHATRRAAETASQASIVTAEALLTDLSQAQTALAVVEGHGQRQRAVLAGHEAQREELEARMQARSRRAAELFDERDSLLARLNARREEANRLNDQIAQAAARIDPAEAELASLEEQQAALETEEGRGRETLHRLETEHSRLDLEYNRTQGELEMLRRQIEDDLGLVDVDLSEDQVGQPYLPLQPLIAQLPLLEELPEGVENDIRRFRIQLNRLGSVNPNAPKEFEELKERHEFLTRQISDLEQAAADLRRVITELDNLMEKEFLGTFRAVAGEFSACFKRLFGGGEAQLVLTDPENLADTGVDISARPPGKRLQSLSMLSGGERALTAAALIFALLKVSPTPLCVLDEVDAMLDEANVGRFRQELLDLAQDIQFVVITHNRRTIEAAKTIYGVSMGDDSVSQVYSLRLPEVEEREA